MTNMAACYEPSHSGSTLFAQVLDLVCRAKKLTGETGGSCSSSESVERFVSKV